MEVISSGLASRMGLKIRHKCHLVHLAPQRGTGPAEACPRTLPGQKPILHLRWSHRIRWLVKLVSPIPTGFAEQPSVLQHCTALRFVRVGWDPDRELAPCETGGFLGSSDGRVTNSRHGIIQLLDSTSGVSSKI